MGFHQEVLDYLGRDPWSDVTAAVTEPGPLLALLKQGGVDVLVLCPRLAREARARNAPLLGGEGVVLVVAEEMTVPVLREAIEAGASGVFAWPEERDDLASAIQDLGPKGVPPPESRGRVIGVYGARGGAGCTFIATQLASSLARLGVRTVLVDFDLDFSDVAAAFGIQDFTRTRTAADLLPVLGELSSEHIEDALYRHPGGFSVLLAPEDGSDSSGAYPGLYADAVGLLAGRYGAVILHLPRAVSEVARVGVELANDLLIVTTPDLLSVRGARRAIRAMDLDARRERLSVVVNKSDTSEMTRDDVERALGLPPCAAVRFDARVQRAQARGQVLVERSRRAAKDVMVLAQRFVTRAAQGTRPEGEV